VNTEKAVKALSNISTELYNVSGGLKEDTEIAARLMDIKIDLDNIKAYLSKGNKHG